MEELADGSTKPVIYFRGERKGLVANKTNCMVLAAAFGPETDAWVGKSVVLGLEKVNFAGRMVDGIRVRPVDFDDDVSDL